MAIREELGELYYKITGESKDFDNQVNKTDKKLGGLGKSFGGLGGIITKVFSVIAVAGIVALSKELINVASDAEETQNKFDVVFSNISGGAQASANELSESYGLSRRASQELLSGTGDLLAGFGFTQTASLDLSTEVQKLAVDLASFSNFSGGAEGASQAITSALLGEREAMKALGISISEADIKQLAEDQGIVGELTRQQKAQLTLELAIRQSGNAIGDFERSQNSFANQSKVASANIDNLKVSLGSNLLPIANIGVTTFNDLATSALQVADDIGEFVTSAEGAEKIGNIIGGIAGSVNALFAIIKPILTSVFDAFKEIIAPIQELGEELDGGAGVFKIFAGAGQIVVGIVTLLSSVISGAINNVINFATAIVSTVQVAQTALKVLKGEATGEDFSNAIDKAGASWAEFGTELVGGYGDALSEITNLVTNFASENEEQAGVIEDAYNSAYTSFSERTTQALEDATDKTGEEGDNQLALIAEQNEEELKLLQEALEEKARVQKEEDELEKERLDKKNKYIESKIKQLASVITSVWSGINDIQDNFNEEELQNLQKKIDAEEEGTDTRIALEEQFDKKKKQFAYDQAKRDKEGALFSAIINGALAVVSFLAQGDYVGAILAGVLSAVEIGVISSKSLPALEQGGVIPDLPGASPTADSQLARVNAGEVITPADEAGQTATFNLILNGKLVAKDTVAYINKGTYTINLKRGTA